MTWHIKRDYDNRPRHSPAPCLFVFSMTWHIKRDYDSRSDYRCCWSIPCFLWPDISKGITTLLCVFDTQSRCEFSMTWHIKRDYDSVSSSWMQSMQYCFLWPDISKGITTFQPFLLLRQHLVFYDLTYQKGLRRFPVLIQVAKVCSFLWPDISKGITTVCNCFNRVFCSCVFYDLTYQKGLRLSWTKHIKYALMFSMTWHIKRDYDIGWIAWVLPVCWFSMTWHIKRDYDYFAHSVSFWLFITGFLWPDISKGITTKILVSIFVSVVSFLWPDISKGITTRALMPWTWCHPKFSMTWHIKRDYDHWQTCSIM